MASEESDDEPLAALAAAKKLNPEKYADNTVPQDEFTYEPKKKRKRMKMKKTQKSPFKKLPLTFKLSRMLKNKLSTPVIERPADVWLYLKDLNPTGPYSCLLCSEWFISKSKVIIHYVLNHKKDFCGICRYFVADREAWAAHQKFHAPWPCSQCVENFPTEAELREHLSRAHDLVHCRLCHFRIPDNDQYNTHLFQKHSVTNVASKDEEVLWELDYEESPKFLCLLCSRSNNLTSTFFNHYMGYHHFTLKCFTNIISGKDQPFMLFGADVSTEFIESLKGHTKFGYADLDQKPVSETESDTRWNSDDFSNILLPEIKQETLSDIEDVKDDNGDERSKEVQNDLIKSYKGDEDFDVTLMELIVLQKCYYDYLSSALNDINSNIVPKNSDIDYEKAKSDVLIDVECSLCKTMHHTIQTFITHMYKMHSVKSVPVFSCRVCATTFDSQNELDNHISEELGDFEDLWICQFCDKEFDNRETSRRHLTEHWDIMEYENCFSPHLGFKCKHCPTLFWNETDRENHQVRVHFNKHKEQYYKCEICSEVFSDKIWFIHHYLQNHDKEKSKQVYLLKCCLCCIVLPTVEEMRTHFGQEHPEARKVFCSLDGCQYKPLSHKKSFQLHLRSQHSSQSRKDRAATCTVCGREFPTSRACSAHMAQVHGPGKFKCKICKEMLHSMDERKLHYLIRHPGHHPFECSECGKSFQYKSSLYMHKHEHSPNKQSYTCNYCNKVFLKKDSYREHIQIHEGPRHACSYCPMRFVQRSNMLRHERRHTGERPYACPHCSRTFADKGACTSHSRTHSKETSFACLYCGQTFVQKSKLTYHIRKHTGENLETCSICSKLFTSACSLREHMKTHEKVKKEAVKCPLCERTYQDERYMLRHLRTMHTHTHFPCPLCRKNLSSSAGLRHHVITHSQLNVFRCKCCPKSYAVKRSIVKHLRRRHGLKGSEINIKDFYQKLEPRQCQLGLDEEVMTKIFGPPKKTVNDILIGDFVTFTKKIQIATAAAEASKKQNDDDNGGGDDNDDNGGGDDNGRGDDNEDESNDSDEENDQDEETCKDEDGDDNSEEELEPTDFVSVKIEPMDEDEVAAE